MGIIYSQGFGEADYPRGRWEGAVSVTKVRNAARKAGLEVVNARNDSVNRVRTGCSGFLKSPDGRHVYFSQDCSGSGDRRFLYRTAAHDRDWTGGGNNWCAPDAAELVRAASGLMALMRARGE